MSLLGNTISIADDDTAPTVTDHTDFGSTAVAGGIVVRTFTIENVGDSELNLDGTPLVAIDGTHAADFTVTTLPTTPIAIGGMTMFQVRFDPSVSGMRTATLTIASDDANESPYEFQIQGSGSVTSAPEINVQANTVSIADGDSTPTTADHTDFGSSAVSSGTVVRTFTIENVGDSELTLGGTPLVAMGGTHAADFEIMTMPTTPIASGGMTTFQVRFDPGDSGLRTATLTIANDDADESPYEFQIQGSGVVTSAPEIDVQGNTMSIADGDSVPTMVDHTDFGSAEVAGGTVVRTFTIENTGAARLNLGGTPLVAVGGTHAADFTVTTLPTTPIASGGITTFQVNFDPSGSGLRAAMLTIANDDADENSYGFQIQGSGTVTSAPEIDVQGNTVSITDGDTTPTAVDHTDFGSTAVFIETVVRTFTIENTGTATLNLSGTPLVAIAGPQAADFSVTALPTASVASGGITTFQISFAPSGSGLHQATLIIANDDVDENSYEFQIQGNGTITQFLSVSIAADAMSEQGGATTATVSRNTDTAGALTVTLASNDTSEATVPTTVTIPAGQSTSAPFNIAAVNDSIADGTQTVTITASASGHAAGTDIVNVTDNDTTMLDFGDAPTAAQSGLVKDYPVTLAQDGARHAKGSLFLGLLIDVETDGQPDGEAGLSGSGGDDNLGEDDEDGVFHTATILASNATSSGSSIAVTPSGPGKLDAWIDFNRDADWDDDGEHIFTSEEVVEGMNLLSFRVPAGAAPGVAVARFRLSSAGGLAPTGPASDGEVEDHLVTLLNGDAAGSVSAQVEAPGADVLDVVADGNDVVVHSGEIELFRARGSSIQRLDIIGTDGNDTLNVANLDTIFSGLIAGNAGAGEDTLRLTGSGQHLDLTNIVDAVIQGIETIDISGNGDNTLTLDVNEVLNISPTTDILRVQHDDDDTVNFNLGWSVEIPQIVDGQYIHVLNQNNATIQIVNATPFHNPLRPLDTNRDGSVSPLDALIIVNKLNTTGAGILRTPTSDVGLEELFFLDTNGDRSVSPVDVIRIVNFLNKPRVNLEGEAPITHSALAFVDFVDNVPDFGLVDHRDNDPSALPSFATLPVGPAVPKRVAEGEPSALGIRQIDNTIGADLVGAIGAFFSKFVGCII